MRKKKKYSLTTVPNFVFQQENEDGMVEDSVEVRYYNGGIDLVQGDESVYIDERNAKHLFAEILRLLPEAQLKLKQP